MNSHFAGSDTERYIDFLKQYNSVRVRYAYIRTFGCQQNEADSEKIAGVLGLCGYVLTDNFDNADLIILNTCAVRELAEKKLLSFLGNFKACKKRNPELIVGVVGCMGAIDESVERLKNDFHYVSFTLGAGLMHEIPYAIYRTVCESKRSFPVINNSSDIIEGIPTIRSFPHRAYVSIMYGCNNFCSYCIVPYTRGRERSRDSLEIINECRELVRSGVCEITLLGQNVNSYKSDIDFPSLLEKIAEIKGNFIIRFMTSHPKDVSDKLITVMSNNSDKIAPYFHLPLQSGSNRILSDMNRKYTRERFLIITEKLRDMIPGIALSTDVIVGYPDETEEDFLDTLNVINRVKFDAVYAFIYSTRPGTVAAKKADSVSDETKHARISRLLALQDEYSLQNNKKYLEKYVKVLVDSYSERDGRFTGKTASGKLVHFSSDTAKIGTFVDVKIVQASFYDLLGTQK